MQLLNIHLQYQKIPWFKIHFVRQAVCKYSWGISLLFHHLNYCWDCFWGVWYWLRYTRVLGQTFSVCPLPLPSENDGERWQIRCQMMSCNGKQALLWIVIGCVVCLCQSIHLWVRQGSAFHSRWVPPQPHMGQAALMWEKPCCLQLLLICQPQKSSAEMLQGKKNHKCCQLELWRKKKVCCHHGLCAPSICTELVSRVWWERAAPGAEGYCPAAQVRVAVLFFGSGLQTGAEILCIRNKEWFCKQMEPVCFLRLLRIKPWFLWLRNLARWVSERSYCHFCSCCYVGYRRDL